MRQPYRSRLQPGQGEGEAWLVGGMDVPRTGEPARVVTDEGCERRVFLVSLERERRKANQASIPPHQHTSLPASLPIGGKTSERQQSRRVVQPSQEREEVAEPFLQEISQALRARAYLLGPGPF